jgi:hypothetical protein
VASRTAVEADDRACDHRQEEAQTYIFPSGVQNHGDWPGAVPIAFV